MKKSRVGKAASELTKAQFSQELSSHITLTRAEIDALFPYKSDREELARLIDIVLNTADENQKRAKLISNITKVAGAVVRLVEKKVVGSTVDDAYRRRLG